MDPTVLKNVLSWSSLVVGGLSIIAVLIGLALKKRFVLGEVLTNLSIWLINQPLRIFVTGGILLTLSQPFKTIAPYKIPTTWLTAIIAFIISDFIYYWMHRLSHERRFLWAYHSVHHSSEEYNLTTAIRLPWFGTIIDSLFYIPLALVGFDPLLIASMKTLVLLYQYWIHTESIGKLGWFDRVFNSPSNHRVHHASNKRYIDRNHAGVFMIWDQLFGTYAEEADDEKVVYGLTKPIGSYNPVVINFKESVEMIKDVISACSMQEVYNYVCGKPGWKPEHKVDMPEISRPAGCLSIPSHRHLL